MKYQYETPSLPPSTIINYLNGILKLTDTYCIFQSGKYEYCAFVGDALVKDGDNCTLYIFTRDTDYSRYSVQKVNSTWDFELNNQLYIYSNSVDYPATRVDLSARATYVSCIVVCAAFIVLVLAHLFKGRWLKL